MAAEASLLHSTQMHRTTTLSFEYRESHDGDKWLSQVALLLDGVERIGTFDNTSTKYMGMSPRALADQPALMEPSESPHEVILYRCDCGETGCAATVARCYLYEDQVVWDRINWGNPRPSDLKAPTFHDDAIIFDAEQYHDAMGRIRSLADRLQP